MTQFEVGSKVLITVGNERVEGKVVKIEPKTASRPYRLYVVEYRTGCFSARETLRHADLQEVPKHVVFSPAATSYKGFTVGDKVASYHTFRGVVIGFEGDTGRIVCRSEHPVAMENDSRKRYAYLPRELRIISKATVSVCVEGPTVVDVDFDKKEIAVQTLEKSLPCAKAIDDTEMLFIYGHRYIFTSSTGQSYLVTAKDSWHMNKQLVTLSTTDGEVLLTIPRQITGSELRAHGIIAVTHIK